MLVSLQQNLLLAEALSLAFIGPDIEDMTFIQGRLIDPVDLTDRFISATTYVLIGSLPDGMSFNNGVLSGTPNTPGIYGPFIIRAT